MCWRTPWISTCHPTDSTLPNKRLGNKGEDTAQYEAGRNTLQPIWGFSYSDKIYWCQGWHLHGVQSVCPGEDKTVWKNRNVCVMDTWEKDAFSVLWISREIQKERNLQADQGYLPGTSAERVIAFYWIRYHGRIYSLLGDRKFNVTYRVCIYEDGNRICIERPWHSYRTSEPWV